MTKLKSELSRSVGCIQKIATLVPTWLKKMLYYTLLYSKICYGILVWGTTGVSNYEKIIVIQKRALRLLENYKGNIIEFNSSHNFTKHEILKANQIYYFKLLQAIYKEKLYETKQESSNNRFTFRHDTRRKPSMRTNYGKQKMSYQAPNLLNQVDNHLDFSVPYLQYKQTAKSILITHNITYS